MTKILLNFRTEKRNKEFWEHKAREQGKTLTDFIHDKMPEAPKIFEVIKT